MVKFFKSALNRVIGDARHKPSLIELQTFVSDAARIVNDRPLTSVICAPYDDLTPILPLSFLGQQLVPNTPIRAFHGRVDLKQDYVNNVTLAQKFWQSRIEGYLPTLQGRNKWREIRQNLTSGQHVLVADAEDVCKRFTYCLERIHNVHRQIRNGKEIVRRATVTS